MANLLTRFSQAWKLTRAFDFWGSEGWTIVRGADAAELRRDGAAARTAWETHPVVQACVRVIVDILGAVPLEVYSEDADGQDTPRPDHPLQQLLDEPWDGFPGMRLAAYTGLHYLLFGNAFWHLVRGGRNGNGGNGRPSGIRLIHPENIEHAWFDDRELRVTRYDWSVLETGKRMESPAEDIVHFADLSGRSPIFGYPRAAAALQQIASDNEATKYVRQVVSNDGAPTVAVLMPEMSTAQQAKEGEERWHEKRVIRGERGRVHFTNAKDIKVFGFSLSDLEFPDLRAVTREDICAVWPVDPRIVGIQSARGAEGGLSGEQYREARRRLIAQAVSPLMLTIEAFLNVWLAPEFGTVKVRFSPDGLAELTENEIETSNRAIAEYGAGLRTREEARRLVSLPEEMDPAHHIKAGLLGEMLVGDVASLTTGDGAKEIAGLLMPPDGNGDGADEDKKDRVLPTALQPRAMDPDQRTQHWRSFDQLAARLEAPYEATALSLFLRERREVATIMRQVRASDDPPLTQAEADLLIRALRELYAGDGPVREAWQERMAGPSRLAYQTGGREVAVSLGISFDVKNPRVAAAIRTRTARLANYVPTTTANQIGLVLETARTKGWGMGETARTINSAVFGGGARQRSVMIARTETIGALNEAGMLAAAEGGMTEKEWLTEGDDRVRDTHADQDGERIDIGATFANGCRFPGDPMAAAEETIQCRCTLNYY